MTDEESEYRAGSAEEMEANHPPKQVAEEQKLKDIIQEAWCAGDLKPKDKFGDFLGRSARGILEAGYRLLPAGKAPLLTDEQIASELYDIWQEAKSTETDNWDNQTFQTLPNKHKREYYLTAQRLIASARAGYRLLPAGKAPLLNPEELIEIEEETRDQVANGAGKQEYTSLLQWNTAKAQNDADNKFNVGKE